MLAYRPHELAARVAAGLDGLPHFTKVELAELSRAESEQAIRAKLAQLYPARRGSLQPALVEKLMERAQGNPFYLEELLNYLRDWGLDPFDEGDLAKIELPDSLHALILSRIDQLSDGEKLTLRVASIIGRLFRAAWLTGYFPELSDLRNVATELDRLNELDITPLDAASPELAYLFKHIVTHEVTYESLPYAMRARLHEQLAQYLERLYGDAPPLDLLAHHYSQGTDLAKQREYLRKAGNAAQAAFANETAASYFARLLPLLTDPAEQIDLLLQWGELLQLMGRWGDAEARLKTALTLAEGDVARTAQAQYRLALVAEERADYPGALQWLEQGHNSWSALQDQVGLALVLIQNGRVYYRQGNYAAAKQQTEQGLALAQRAGDRHSVMLAFNMLGNIVTDQGDHSAARLLYENSLALARELDNRNEIARVLNNLGTVAQAKGDMATATALYGESVAIARQIGYRGRVSLVLYNMGDLAIEQGDYVAAKALGTECQILSIEMGSPAELAYNVGLLGRVAYHQGAYAKAQELYEQALSIAREIGDTLMIDFAIMRLGLLAYLQEDHVKARAFYEETLALAQQLGAQVNIAEVVIYSGILAHEAGDYVAAQELYVKGLTLAREIDERYHIVLALQSLALVGYDLGDRARAKQLFQESLATAHQGGYKRGIVEGWIGLAAATYPSGAGDSAVCLCAAAETLRAAMGLKIGPMFQRVYDQTVAAAHADLGAAGFTTAWARGAGMSMDEAVQLSLQDA